jgi:DNA repair protein RadC
MQNMFLTLKKTGSILVSRTSIAGPEDAARMMSFLKRSDREKCYVINMDKNNKVLNIHLISMGTVSASLVHPREAFKTTLLSKAKKVWFVHNHPSGKSDPSKDDKGLTDRLYHVGKDLKIDVVGQVVVGLDNFSAVYPEHTESVLSGPSPKEEERKKRIKVVTAELSEEMMASVLSAHRKITEPSHAAAIGATILSPDKPTVAVIYLSAQRNVLGIEVIGSHLKKLGRSTVKVLKSSVLHNADSVLVVASKNSKIDHAAYMELNGKFEGLGIELLDTVKCSTRVGESFISYKKGDTIFKSLRRLIQKAVLGGVRPGHKYIKRVRTPAGKWRYYYYDKKTGRVIAQEDGKTVAVGKKPEQASARRKESTEEEGRGLSQPPGRKEIPPVAQEEDPEFCKLYWRQIRESGFSKMKFSQFVDPETEKQGDKLLLRGETSGYNVTMYEVGEAGGFAAAMKAKELSLIYSMYNIHPEHGKKVITEIAKTGAKFDYAIVKKASAVRWDESWGEDPGVEVQKHGDQLIGKSLEYSIIFRPDSKEDAEKIAEWLNDKADANHEDAVDDSWYVPDVRQTGKETVDKYEDAVVNMKQVGNQQLIVMTQETELEGFEHLNLKTNSGLRQYFTKGMAKSRQVKRPGLRGGRYYISKQGYVRYGDKPRGRLNKERLAKLIQMYKPKIESHLRPLIRRYRLSADAMPDLMSAYTEGALRSLQEKSSNSLDPWLHARKRGYETAKRWAQKQGPFRLPNPEQGYRDLMKIKSFQEKYARENQSSPSDEKIAEELNMRVDRVKELLAWDQLRGKEISPGTPGLPSVPSAEEVFETEEEERKRQRAFETVRQETGKLPAKQRKIAVALMGEGATLKETRQRIGVSTRGFYRDKQKVRRKLKKLKPIWVRFGKAIRAASDLT